MSEQTRAQMPTEYKWRLCDIFYTDTEWKNQYAEVRALCEKMSAFSGRLGDGEEALLSALDAYAGLSRKMEEVYVYAHMLRDEDNNIPSSQEMAGQADKLAAEVEEACAFLSPELLALPAEALAAAAKARPEFARFLAEVERDRAHTLSQECEALLAQAGEMGQTADTAFRMLHSADMKFSDVQGMPLSHGKFIPLLESDDRAVRREAFKTYYAQFEAHKNTLAALYSGSVKKDIFFARARGYASSRAAALAPDEVEEKVYDQLIEATNAHLPAMHRYMKLRKKLLGVDELHMYDIYVPLVNDFEAHMEYKAACEEVMAALKPLGEEFAEGLAKAFSDGWIDVMENPGKTPGAYSWGCYKTHPFVLLNWQGRLDDEFTLAHELGHAQHSYLSNKYQPYMTAEYRIFVAEVASTLCECLLLKYRLRHAKSRQEKAYLLNHLLEQFRTTMFRQTMFAQFERDAHAAAEQGETLTAEKLCAMYRRLNEEYYGSEMIVDEQIDIEWARIPHFYRAFYVYQYATGFAAAMALSEMVPEDPSGALSFLKAGGSKAPLDILRDAGVDLSTPAPVDAALTLFENTLDEFARLME